MPTSPRDYRAFVVRLWRVRGREGPDWRASLEDAHTGDRHGFADLEHLIEFLEQSLAETRNDAQDTSNDQLTIH